MTDHDARLTRRALLAASVAVVAGCTSTRRTAAADPDAAMLAASRSGELQLLSTYVAGTPEHTAHLTHLRALGGELPASGATSSPGPAAPYGDEKSSVPVLQAAARGVRSGSTAAVLASIAASHAVLSAGKR